MLMTWLPYPNIRLSVHVLDSLRLGVQAGQAATILRLIAGREGGVRSSHRIVEAWREFPEALVSYLEYCIRETRLRDQDIGMPLPRSREGIRVYDIPKEWTQREVVIPDWIGVERIHASHRGTLLSMAQDWYCQYAWSETPVRRFEWPGAMPRVGQTIVHQETGEVCMVHSLDGQGRPVLIRRGELVPIERRDIRLGVWRRAVVVD